MAERETQQTLSLSVLGWVHTTSHAIFSTYPNLMENPQISPRSMEFQSQNPNLRDLLEIPVQIRSRRDQSRRKRAGAGAPPRRSPEIR